MEHLTLDKTETKRVDVPDKLLLNIPEVASILGCGRSFIYQLIGKGELHVIKFGRLSRIASSDLRAMVERKLFEAGGTIQ